MAFVADFETKSIHLKTKFDMKNNISINHEKGNDANRLLWAGWISADKKPISEKDVLICTTDNYIGIGWYYDDSKEWAFECDKDHSDHSGIVAYWCDLPACP